MRTQGSPTTPPPFSSYLLTRLTKAALILLLALVGFQWIITGGSTRLEDLVHGRQLVFTGLMLLLLSLHLRKSWPLHCLSLEATRNAFRTGDQPEKILRMYRSCTRHYESWKKLRWRKIVTGSLLLPLYVGISLVLVDLLFPRGFGWRSFKRYADDPGLFGMLLLLGVWTAWFLNGYWKAYLKPGYEEISPLYGPQAAASISGKIPSKTSL